MIKPEEKRSVMIRIPEYWATEMERQAKDRGYKYATQYAIVLIIAGLKKNMTDKKGRE